MIARAAIVLLGAIALLIFVGKNAKAAEHCIASHYGHKDGYHGSAVACPRMGPFNTWASSPYTVAHKSAACGSWLTITNLSNGRSIRARVTDRGPYIRGRCVDLGKAGAEAIGMGGLAKVRVE